jgi:hypothetical protein
MHLALAFLQVVPQIDGRFPEDDPHAAKLQQKVHRAGKTLRVEKLLLPVLPQCLF